MTKTFDATTNGIATIGTLVLEWTRLSDISGDPSYGNLTQTAESHLLYPKPTKGEVFPGLIGTYLSLKTGEIEVTSGGWSGGDDSFYEYLLKMFIYDKERFAYYGKRYIQILLFVVLLIHQDNFANLRFFNCRWEVAADSTLKFLKSHPPNRPDITFVAEFNSATSISKNQGHLTCFIGGNFLLGGHTLNRRDLKQFGLDLIDGCHHTYANTAAKIGPERFSWADLPADAPESQKAFFAKNGFYTTHGAYILRPETIESYYHGWRLTGDPKYREWAWEAFQAINASCRVPNGYASLRNVDKAPPQTAPGDFYDYQESFWFAETLKYLWLIFGGGKLGEVHVTRAPQEWVFNTEAHPVRVFKKLLLEGREGAEGERKGEATAEEAKTSDGGMGKEGVVPVHRIWAWALAGLVLCGFIV